MARNLILYPDPILKKVSRPVEKYDDPWIHNLISDMVKIMGQFNGLGLSAIQVGEPVRVMVMCVEEDKVPLVLINPVISKTSEKTELMKEGCLSFPGIMSKVERNTKITVDYRDSFGNLYIRDLDGVFAQCAQHEIDHMNGVLFVEKVSPLYKLSLKDKLKRRRF